MLISFIIIHYSSDDLKSEMARKCLEQLNSLKDGTFEIIFINNGRRDSELKTLCDVYLECPVNSMGKARNMGFEKASGDYICFMDNDIFVEKPFWERGIELLKKYPDKKLIITPIWIRSHKKYSRGELEGHVLNERTGSNCFLLRRESFLEIGKFDERIITKDTYYNGLDGVKFTNQQVRTGYLAVYLDGYAKDLGTKNYKYIYE